MKELQRTRKRRKGVTAAVFLLVLTLLTGCVNVMEEGSELLAGKDYEGAKAKFQESIEKSRDLAESYRGLGLCYWEQQDYEKAADAFGRALDNGAKKTATLYNLLGICEMKLENPEKAVYYFENGQELPDGDAALIQEMAFNTAAAYEQLGDYVTAREKLALYVSAYPDDARAQKELEFLNTQAPKAGE